MRFKPRAGYGLALVLASAGLISWWFLTDARTLESDGAPSRRSPLTYEPADSLITARASSALPGHSANLVLDGRSHGQLPFAWRPSSQDDEPWVELQFQQPVGIIGLSVAFESAPDERPELIVDGTVVSGNGEVHREGRNLLAVFAQTRFVSRVRLQTTEPVAAITPIPSGVMALLIGGPKAEPEVEMLIAAGVPSIVRIPPQLAGAVGGLSAMPRVVVSSSVQRDNPHFDSIEKAVNRHLTKGGRVLELGFRSALCGSPVESPPMERHSFHRDENHVATVIAGVAKAPVVEREARVELTADRDPAVLSTAVGPGTCVRYLFDLVGAIVRRRQGDPALRGQDTNGRGGIQPQDLFFDDLEPSDYDRRDADALWEFLIQSLDLPFRLHPLPPRVKGILVYTVDQDFVPNEGVLAQSDQIPGGVTFLLTDAEVGGEPDVDFKEYAVARLDLETLGRLAERDHEVGIHPNLEGLDPSSYGSALRSHVNRFIDAYGTPPAVVRNHHLTWDGFTNMAELHAEAGLLLNLDYMALAFENEGRLGFLNGSAFAARFVRQDGSVVPIYQLGTQLDDHVLLPRRFGYHAMSVDDFVRFARDLVTLATRDDPFFITVNHHPAWWFKTNGAIQRGLIELATANGLEVWGAGRFLRHVEGLRQVLAYEVSPGTYRMRSPIAASLLVARDGGARVEGEEPFSDRSVGDLAYRWYELQPGVATVVRLPP